MVVKVSGRADHVVYSPPVGSLQDYSVIFESFVLIAV